MEISEVTLAEEGGMELIPIFTFKPEGGDEETVLASQYDRPVFVTHYPAAVGFHMTNTDSTPFMDEVPAISVRENERGMQIGAGWNPHWHQPTDLYSSYSDKDFLLGLNAAQTTLAAVAQLTGAKVKN
jgi:hypothetical protein